MKSSVTVYIVVEFTYPEWDTPGEFDCIVGVFHNKEDADKCAAERSVRDVIEAELK